MHVLNNPVVLLALATAAQANPVEVTSDLQARANTWEAHAKYYGLGGKIGNEILVQGTWSNPIKNPGQDAGPCTARIGGIGGDAFDVRCNCKITGSGPLRFTSTCFVDWGASARNGDWAGGFSVAFECNAFNSCTGPNAYKVSGAHSRCHNQSGNVCNGFRVTP
ncbi:hypothetical protein ABOM_005784 [Aspergillus bombycis]|uniref:Secreted protein n=1 Tax=Aspergillus bombycis TaxID=109264 RepID=A0A1F8A009_9EURO|nr:hypothetical protein ABOM_005784 [Aspergillus bombycis]OGM45050.1 hypothetical protein ABOM_005784 [Aspergillus bombycis]